MSHADRIGCLGGRQQDALVHYRLGRGEEQAGEEDVVIGRRIEGINTECVSLPWLLNLPDR